MADDVRSLRTPGELLNRPISDMVRALQTREITARELLEVHLERGAAAGLAPAADVADRARVDAKQADEVTARGGARGALHGVPYVVSDGLDHAGIPTTWGLSHRGLHNAAADDPAVALLRPAGPISMGKARATPLMLASASEADGTPHPLDPERGAGACGTAAIVASGGAAFGLGIDVAGSLRTSAHLNGVHALKPTAGLLPTSVSASARWLPREVLGLVQPGPVGRRVEDLARVLEVLARGAGRVISSPDRVTVHRLRIGFCLDGGPLPVTPAVRRAVQAAADTLASLGATVVEWKPPAIESAWSGWLRLVYGDGGQGLQRVRGTDEDALLKRITSLQRVPWFLRPMRGDLLSMSGQEHEAALLFLLRSLSDDERRFAVRQRGMDERQLAAAARAAHLDAVLCPPSAFAAMRPEDAPPLALADAFPLLFAWTGWPAGTVSTTRVREGEETDRVITKDRLSAAAQAAETGTAGLPVGVQVASWPGREDIVLAVMKALEDATRRVGGDGKVSANKR